MMPDKPKISSAKDRKMSMVPTGLPDVSGAVQSFLQPAVIGVVTKKQVSGYTQEDVEWIYTQAVRQAFTAQQLLIRPEGERSWKWFTLHTLPEVCLHTDDLIIIHNVRMRIMEVLGYGEYGFNEYHAIEDYVTRVEE
jgi:hypothetical protein